MHKTIGYKKKYTRYDEKNEIRRKSKKYLGQFLIGRNVKMPPAGHYGDVEKEIGRACVQLASPDFKYMNGETITLEGGMGLRP